MVIYSDKWIARLIINCREWAEKYGRTYATDRLRVLVKGSWLEKELFEDKK